MQRGKHEIIKEPGQRIADGTGRADGPVIDAVAREVGGIHFGDDPAVGNGSHRAAENEHDKNEPDGQPDIAGKQRRKDRRNADAEIEDNQRFALGAQLVGHNAPDGQKAEAGQVVAGQSDADPVSYTHLRQGGAAQPSAPDAPRPADHRGWKRPASPHPPTA